jgi:hypothetical protein
MSTHAVVPFPIVIPPFLLKKNDAQAVTPPLPYLPSASMKTKETALF